ncbi:ImmA/IrrE family metallo-endopeptidase [Metaclostridioides mangenotii]|uniref:ImmA/IrrE family metallo-endopeptidase n=1 Tax=Metaclostridioides mangenotii TaxID=1540 RepID=UPI000463F947|nr:ImmA/IrrE family metallo-endopeptidase [Clostridioides mangenotii]
MSNIKKTIKALVKTYNTRNVYELCSCLNINILKDDLKYFKGYFLRDNKSVSIVIDSNLSEYEERCVVAHELGHVVLHSGSNICFLTNYTYSNTKKLENEANEFAAELLVSDENIQEAMEKQFSMVEQMACYFEVPNELIEYKFKHKL